MKHLTYLFLLFSLPLFFGCSQDVEEGIEEDVPDVTVTLQNFGVSAWRITAIEGATGLADVNTDNPDITLEVGKRYKFINLGRLSHPLDFRDTDEGFLLAQGASSGSFANDTEVNARINEESITFTLTQELYDALATYNCAIHAVMRGNFVKTEPQVPEPDVVITFVNSGSSAWRITSVTGATDIVSLNMDNATLTLTKGLRYKFINQGGAGHPLQLINASNTVLLSKNSGSFNAANGVDLVVEGNDFTFTLTDGLGNETNKYRCGVHTGSMVGNITVN
ncbi:plastocyanin/azurin family copper-binding protein [Cytophagales bacterium LB-30]|uniref:Plastocyanin/azurin family copper-binding protein n=1 Tax=Shiella aurantiaca TaxID=3058365 RepID=A0ABT8F457_9BACT|nr:plastocyanin/azurin family copper-binding protein [Shiella aurantiaca]MDN4165185.1 plastocyanin/azurin family copper-binding protein [Shiella aurantiaca]